MKNILIIKDGLNVGGTTTSFLSFIDVLSNQSDYEIFVWINGESGNLSNLNGSKVKYFVNNSLLHSFCRTESFTRKMCRLLFTKQILLYFKMKIIQRRDANNRELIRIYQEMDIKSQKHRKKMDCSKFDLVITWEELYPLYFLAENIINCKKIAWIHPDYIQCGFDSKLDKKEFNKIDKIIAVSQNGLESLKKSHPEMKDKFAQRSFVITILGFFLASGYVYAADSIAVVDLQKIVSNSSQVKQLKQEHKKKMDELNKIIVNARGAIANETDSAKILQLEEKYTNEFNTKKQALEKDYANRLEAIEKNIQAEIAKKAQKDKYDYVFAKSVVLYGGKDITGEINVK